MTNTNNVKRFFGRVAMIDVDGIKGFLEWLL